MSAVYYWTVLYSEFCSQVFCSNICLMNYCASATATQSQDTRQQSLTKSIVGMLTDNYTVIRLNISFRIQGKKHFRLTQRLLQKTRFYRSKVYGALTATSMAELRNSSKIKCFRSLLKALKKGRVCLHDSSGVKFQFTTITLTILELSYLLKTGRLMQKAAAEKSFTSAFAPTPCPREGDSNLRAF